MKGLQPKTYVFMGVGALVALLCLSMLSNLPDYIQTSRPDYTGYGQLLKRIVKGELVDYQAIKNAQELDSLLEKFQDVRLKDLSDEERLCFWINASNLCSLKVVYDKYPITDFEKVEHIRRDRRFPIAGKSYTLTEIDRSILGDLQERVEPLAIFLTAPGAIGYPPLLDHPVTPETLKQDAVQAAVHFVMDTHKNYWVHNTFYMSKYLQSKEHIVRPKYGSAAGLVKKVVPDAVRATYDNPMVVYEFAPRFDWMIADVSVVQAANTPDEPQHEDEPQDAPSAASLDPHAIPDTPSENDAPSMDNIPEQFKDGPPGGKLAPVPIPEKVKKN